MNINGSLLAGVPPTFPINGNMLNVVKFIIKFRQVYLCARPLNFCNCHFFGSYCERYTFFVNSQARDFAMHGYVLSFYIDGHIIRFVPGTQAGLFLS